MVEDSMRENIICAIERTRAELETCHAEKRVWFLAPTVTLCEQQYEVFKSNLPGYGIQLLCGRDNVDHWTEQSAWDAVLLNVRIVLSTHQVLVDALTHAFVKMSGLALLIFDEAHHCTLNHPAHRIMSDFYMPRMGQDQQLPKVLGLSASPVMRAKATSEDLQEIERNLSSTAKTPKLHRSELMRYVHRPQLVRIDYPVEVPKESRIIFSLRNAFQNYDLKQDPYVLDLVKLQGEGHDVTKQMHKVVVGGKSYCREQLKSLLVKAEDMAAELGTSSMEWYMHQNMAQFRKIVHSTNSLLFDWTVNEKEHLLQILSRFLPLETECPAISLAHISRKVELLVEVLVAEAKDDPDFTCLIFVEQRVWVAVLAEILSIHPQTRHLLRVGTFVGTSQSSKRKINVATLAEPINQQATLNEFRVGTINVILATSVLEEGIDVSSCHLVICFERPKNLKSFVQRRGRARKQESKYFIFFPEAGRGRPPESWESLEEQMKKAYLDDLRQVKLAEKRELQDENGQRFFQVAKTGALMTLDNASQHLHHFCALLGSGPYLDTRPQFDFMEPTLGKISARVTLPISVDPAVRTATGPGTWVTERMAKKDAAFEAYMALYKAGLVNDNLLPAQQEVDDELAKHNTTDQTPSLVQASPTFDPWPLIAQCQQQNPEIYYRTLLILHGVEEKPIHMLLLTPATLPTIQEILLYWNNSTRLKVVGSCMPNMTLATDEIDMLKSVTYKILSSVFHSRMAAKRCDFPYLLVPCDSSGDPLSNCRLPNWGQGCRRATALIAEGRHDMSQWGLISQDGDARKCIPRITFKATSGEINPLLQLVRLPKRRDFLHPVNAQAEQNDAYTRTEELAASECIVDELPASVSIFALLFPSILHRLTIALIAETLRATLLAPVSFDVTDIPLIVRAITSSATEDDNYQRLEFLGDCILKFIASVHLMSHKLKWPESLLTGKKGRIVSNGFLARASIAAGLDKFVITKRFTCAKWSPRYSRDMLLETEDTPTVERSSKLIADVIESLIGASYTVGGFDKALHCIQTLLPLEPWTPVPVANTVLYEAALADATPINFTTLENLIGHNFHKKMLLLEALTHGSFQGANTQTHSSYERLEFLGDAVLDYIISKRLYAHEPPLSHQKMHGIRTAMVNASFLAFRMFETTLPEETTDKSTLHADVQQRALWQFLRSSEPALNVSRDIALRQHNLVREKINDGVLHDARFPWHLFAQTDPPKFLSDIVESVIGAIYIDSHGDISACEVFVRRLGILDCLERIFRDSVDCLHPKERINHLVMQKKMKYVRVHGSEEAGTRGNNRYRCQVKVGGEDVGGVVEGLKRLQAETIAAWKVVTIFENRADGATEDASEDEFYDTEGGVMLQD
ncbi:dicer-like protein 2 [Ophiobolus disseminans]|uniref:Dicer-like protein 2 n=1 Tax=Ophiobolus disseminans TaxID=1469910 RepID=A0A6A7ABA1_9PLEO|nr:dicer-like protein 2 [Ophiobolus disseminans]